ncbi:MAG: hypothetical protein EOS07_24870 [Mesorhizobium sp.]|nr:MAG: hypothetical protein EOS07_24870 [Mesorhizobium sp.]
MRRTRKGMRLALADALDLRRLAGYGAAALKKSGQFALHTKALPGNPYDGHPMAAIMPPHGEDQRTHHKFRA